jgi:hypothetical protein
MPVRPRFARRYPPSSSNPRWTNSLGELNAEDLAPDPTPNKVLATTDGTSTAWIDAGGGGPHSHAQSDVTGLVDALAGKAATTDPRLSDARTPTAHAHGWDAVTDKPSTFTPSSHAHAITDTTGLQAALDGKVGTADARLTDARAPLAHTQAISTITNLQAALDAKSDVEHTHAGGSPVDQTSSPTLPVGFLAANLTATKTITSTNSFAVYMGRAGASYTTITLRFRVTTQAATITWAEVAIATGAPVLGGNPSLTRRGFTNTAAIVNSLGLKSVAVTVSGIVAGDHLWAVIGNQATTAAVIRAGLADDLQVGTQASAVVRPSLMATPQAFTLEGATVACPWIAMTCA